jgi:hypothetical protein
MILTPYLAATLLDNKTKTV